MKTIVTINLLLLFTVNIFAIPGHNLCSYENNLECCNKTPVGWCANDADFVFKILRENEWEHFERTRLFHGSIHDQRDGYIHLSTADQLGPVLEKYFEGVSVYIVAFSPSIFGLNLIWENNYPHLYNVPLIFETQSGFFFFND